jgi:hypothetical protein
MPDRTDRTRSTLTVELPPELQPPPRIPTGPDSEAVILRHTFRIQILAEDVPALETTAVALETKAREEHDHSYGLTDAIGAAALDLLAVAAWLDWWGDNRGDEMERHEIRLAAAVLDAVEPVAEIGRGLMAIAEAAAREVQR